MHLARPDAPAGLWALFRRFLPYLRPSSPLVALTVLLVLLSPAVGGALLWLLKLVVDEVLVAGRFDLLFPTPASTVGLWVSAP